jgi:hypothetical protein
MIIATGIGMLNGKLDFGVGWIAMIMLITLVHWEWQSYQEEVQSYMVNEIIKKCIEKEKPYNGCNNVERSDNNLDLQELRSDEVDDSDKLESKKG